MGEGRKRSIWENHIVIPILNWNIMARLLADKESWMGFLIAFQFSRLYMENDASFINTWVPRKSLLDIFSGISQIIIDPVFIRTSL